MTITATITRAHGDLDCADAETLLHDSVSEIADLRARLGIATQSNDDLLQQVDLLRIEGDRLRALLDDVSRKNITLAEERDGLVEQVKILHGELAAAEADTVPDGTIAFGTVAREHMVAQYRQASRITRGPVPPSVVSAVAAARDQIAEVMAEAGREAVTAVVRREVRRRRRAQTRAQRR